MISGTQNGVLDLQNNTLAILRPEDSMAIARDCRQKS